MINRNGISEKRVYVLCITILILTSIFSLGYYHLDEHFQILEFAGLKLNLTSAGNLPWEYKYQLRSAAQPLIVFMLYKFVGLFGITNPFIITFLLRLISAALSFVSSWMLYRLYKGKINDPVLRKWFLLLTFFLWFAVFNGVRFSSENWSGIFFTIAFALFFISKKKNSGFHLATGVLLGWSYLFRFQAGFLVAGFLLWMVFISKEKIKNIFFLMTGIICMVMLGILIDRWFYGKWTFTAWNYFEQAVMNDGASAFGTDPWWYYFKEVFLKLTPPFSLLIILPVLFFIFYKWKNPVTWCIVPFLLIHFIVGHKEIRFLFPIIGFVPIMIVTAFEVVQQKFIKDFSVKRYTKIFMTVYLWVNCIILVIVIFRPADGQIALYRKIYNHYEASTTLYYIDKNPYDRILDIQFYKRNNLNIQQISSADSIPSSSDNNRLIVFSNHSKPDGFEQKNKLIYSSMPEWMMNFNFNHWMDRTKIWYVFELNAK
jgi:GPI mannosyltransferase 3